MKKFFALIVTAVTLLSIVAAPLAGAAPFLTDPNGLTAGTRDAQTLDEALNVEGGELTFFNGDSDNALDWSIDIDAAKPRLGQLKIKRLHNRFCASRADSRIQLSSYVSAGL